jgi:type I restriction enzyme, S subunit
MRDSGFFWLGEVPEHWKICSVKRITKILRGKFSHRPRNDPRFYDGQYPFIQTGDIARSGRRITQYSQTLNEAGYAISKEFPAGTVVMVITGAKTGEVSILGFDACFPDSAVGFVPNHGEVSPDFLYYLFGVLKSGLDEVVIVSTQENLNVDRIGSLKTVCPPSEEQNKIVEFLDAQLLDFDIAEQKAERQIETLQEYRQILIASIVTGKIKV